ncbi:alpha/beta fold hydrolase [Pseudoroseomonas ludipueritiae]|uniref:Alpha/beta fold hydrolase n=1 Tax=Pseudoroseomonas ludipueritiae TaxID=198093 RepID=A0ABR7RCL9_9PROT|nr:alpha/beta fold hydrolase [Pseudoroseomonas ludipueritiae]MBC9179423.1 alpha/beta fold hydrolase [Pseudoroseomonas ludipueritiae]MCG7363324.1 alpha/beta fold hydrolase [Roseomonas sp. ACRSG]
MFIDLADMLVHYVVEGPETAPPLLLLHSIGTTQSIWDAQAKALAGRFRVIRPDMRGHGMSSITPGDYSMRQLAQDALALLDALGIRRAHVAGTSIGGRIAQQIAVEAPERMLSLCLLNTALEFPSPARWQGIIDDVRREGTKVLADAVMPRWVVDTTLPSSRGLRRMLLRTDKTGYAGAACALRDATAADILGRIQAPCTVIAGERDPAAPAEAVTALQAAIPGAELVMLPGAGHITTYEFADAVTAQMQTHFDRLSIT